VPHRLVLLALLALPGLPLPADSNAAPAKRKKYALLVGVRSYEHASLPPLLYPENDVEELGKALRGKAAGFDEVVVLTNSRGTKDSRARPTARNIRAQLRRLARKAEAPDLVLVGLVGHGLRLTITDPIFARDTKAGFFCPADAAPRDTKDFKQLSKTLIPLSELFDILYYSRSGANILLLDAARGDPRLERNVCDYEWMQLIRDEGERARPPRGTTALFSCGAGERAYETRKLGRGHGLFFHRVIEGLRGQAANDKGEVNWHGLAEYVSDQVEEDVPALIGEHANQTPHESGNLDGPPPVLARPGARPVEVAPEGKKYASPQAVFEAAAGAVRKKDWKTFHACLSKESGEALVFQILAFELPADKVEETGKALEKVFNRNRLRKGALRRIMRETEDIFSPETRKKMAARIKDRSAFYGDMMKLLDEVHPKRGLPLPKDAELKDLRIEGTNASGTAVSKGDGKRTSVKFVKEGGGWKIALPRP
jgi:hypothetical protein